MMGAHKLLFALGFLLSITLCAHSQSAEVRQRYQKFVTQHIYGNMNEYICDREMRSRKITETGSNNCKQTNTFIQASAQLVKSICDNAGTHYRGNLYKSNQPFAIVTCKHHRGARHPSCEYKGHRSTRYIAIACEEGWPVHYDDDVVIVQQ